MFATLKHIAFSIAIIITITASINRYAAIPAPTFTSDTYRLLVSNIDNVPLFYKEFVPTLVTTPQVHSAALVELPNKAGIFAAWFGGSREGAADVAIYGATRTDAGWSQIQILVDRKTCETELGSNIRKLGNPTLVKDSTNRIWLFFVIASWGGWSTSSIAYKISENNGQSFSATRQLITSPFFNLSTLVRSRPLLYADGSIALPAYHELLAKFGLLLRIRPNGQILSATNIGNGRTAIQPTIVAIDSKQMLALLRRTGTAPHMVLWSYSHDGGNNWSLPQATNLPNPDSSIAAINDVTGKIILAYNPLERGRHILSLANSVDGKQWQKLKDVEQGKEGDEYSYPFLILDAAGIYHFVYTWQRQRIAYLHFNHIWLNQSQGNSI
jgi:predicted neuraminidase